MPNPFENDDASCFVLVNDEGQHSLWPAFAGIPAGWKAVHGEDTRATCLEYAEQHWTDTRPLSLVRAMAGDAS
ncbi:MbtH family protein [Streptomyces sp. S1D4-11]|nr:MbtH family protein [Streptomyces sp. S1D4-11]QIY98705.1 MbtH family protein [Streptomyces sp. S1D4-11]